MFATGALGLLSANASAVTAAAGDGNSTSGGRHCEGGCWWLLLVGVVGIDRAVVGEDVVDDWVG